MEERSPDKFEKCLSGLIEKYEMQCPKFMAFYKTYYATPEHTRKWATCYRQFDHANTDTNMFCESFHNKLKTFYLDRPPNKRLDDCWQLKKIITGGTNGIPSLTRIKSSPINQNKVNVIVD